MTAKDSRIVVRISAEDDAWLTAAAEALGCDKATMVRMMIRQRRTPNVREPAFLPAEAPAAPPPPFNPHGASVAANPVASGFYPARVAPAETPPEMLMPESPVAAETADAIMAARLAEAEQGGLAARGAPMAADDDDLTGQWGPEDHGAVAIPLSERRREGPFERGQRWRGRG